MKLRGVPQTQVNEWNFKKHHKLNIVQHENNFTASSGAHQNVNVNVFTKFALRQFLTSGVMFCFDQEKEVIGNFGKY